MDIISKDITTVSKGVLLNGVNCQHRMGSGVAKAYMTKWPKVRQEYMALDSHSLGQVQYVQVEPDVWVLNCHTQNKFGYDGAKYASSRAVVKCLRQAAAFSLEMDLPLYTPMIGCGLGGLSWEDEVKPAIEAVEEDYSIKINVCVL